MIMLNRNGLLFSDVSPVAWMSLFLRNAFNTSRNSLKAARSEKQWRIFFHSGTGSTFAAIFNTVRGLLHVTCFLFSGELVQIMMATANENLSAKFCNRVLKFFTKLFQLSKSTVGIHLK